MLLEQGDSVRYKGLGAGRVVGHVERNFQGNLRIFAVIFVPHRDMEVQVPVGDPAVLRKLNPVLSTRQVKKLLRELKEPGERLPRTWDQREESGMSILRNGNPESWAALLQAYATARGQGLTIAASDADIVRELQSLLAAELWSSVEDLEFAVAQQEVSSSYQAGVRASGERLSGAPAKTATAV